MMKLRPKMLESGKGSLGGLGTWIPVVVVVLAVVLHLADVIPVLWAAIPTAVALLYSMAEPVVFRLVRAGQFPPWARVASLVLLVAAVGWAVYAAAQWYLPGTPIAEGDLVDPESVVEVRPEAPGELRDYLLEVSVTELPEGDKEISFPFSLRVGRADVRGHFGRDRVVRRFASGQGTIEARDHEIHRLRVALDPDKDRIRLMSLVRDPTGPGASAEDGEEEEEEDRSLQGPVHVVLRATPFTRTMLWLISVPLLVLAALVEAFEDRSRQEKARPTMLVGGILAAVVYFLLAVNADNVLMGVLGATIAGLGGAIVAFVLAFLVSKVIRPRRRAAAPAPADADRSAKSPKQKGRRRGRRR